MNNNLSQLHKNDFNLWVEQIKSKIKNRDFNDMDWNNLIDEIDDMGASQTRAFLGRLEIARFARQKRALDSYTQRLIEHILKLTYWKSEIERCRRGWVLEAANFRSRINRILKKNPSLKNYLAQEYFDIYTEAVKLMRLQFEIPKDNLISLEQIMEDNYFGE